MIRASLLVSLIGNLCTQNPSPARQDEGIHALLTALPPTTSEIELSEDAKSYLQERREAEKRMEAKKARAATLSAIGIATNVSADGSERLRFDNFKPNPRELREILAAQDPTNPLHLVRKSLVEALTDEALASMSDEYRTEAITLEQNVILPPRRALGETELHNPIMTREEYAEAAENFSKRFTAALKKFQEASRAYYSREGLTEGLWFDEGPSIFHDAKYKGKTAFQLQMDDARAEMRQLLSEGRQHFGFQGETLKRLEEAINQSMDHELSDAEGAILGISIESGLLAAAALIPPLIKYAPLATGGLGAFRAVNALSNFRLISASTPGLSVDAITGIGARNLAASGAFAPFAFTGVQAAADAGIDTYYRDKTFTLGAFANRLHSNYTDRALHAVPAALAFSALPLAVSGASAFAAATSELAAPTIGGGFTAARASQWIGKSMGIGLGAYGGVTSVETAATAYNDYLKLKAIEERRKSADESATDEGFVAAKTAFLKSLVATGTDLATYLSPALGIFNASRKPGASLGIDMTGLSPEAWSRLEANYVRLREIIAESEALTKKGFQFDSPEQLRLAEEAFHLRDEGFALQWNAEILREAFAGLKPGDPMPRNALDVMAANLGTSVETLPTALRFGYDTDSFYKRFAKDGYQPNANKATDPNINGSQAHLSNDGSPNLVSIADRSSEGVMLLMMGVADPRKPPKLSGTVGVLRNVKDSVRVPEVACFHKGVYCQNEFLTPQVGIESVEGLAHWTAKPIIEFRTASDGRPFPEVVGYRVEFKKPVDIAALRKNNPNLSPEELKRLVESQPIADTPEAGLEAMDVRLPERAPVLPEDVFPVRVLSGNQNSRSFQRLPVAENLRAAASKKLGRPTIESLLLNEAADTLHASWQREARANGRTERFKPAKDTSGKPIKVKPEDLPQYLTKRGIPPARHNRFRIDENGHLTEDILGLSNRELHPSNQGENLASAELAMGLILEESGAGGKFDDAFIERASDRIHEAWMSRPANAWAKKDAPHMFSSFEELARTHPVVAEQDRDVVRRVLEVFKNKVVVQKPPSVVVNLTP